MLSLVQNPPRRKSGATCERTDDASVAQSDGDVVPPTTTASSSPGPLLAEPAVSLPPSSLSRSTGMFLDLARGSFGHSTCKFTRVNSDGDVEGASLRTLDLSVGMALGRGGYGTVKAVHCNSTSRLMALKTINKSKPPRRYLCKFLPREIEFLRMVSHPRIIAAHHIIETDCKVLILADLAQNGDLRAYIRNRVYLFKEEVRFLFRQIVEGVLFLHGNSIAHRDLKCENILLDQRMNIKVADFGFVTDISCCPVMHACGSYSYAAPELFSRNTESYDALRADVWSLGVVLFAMLTGQLVFGSEAAARASLGNRQVVFPPGFHFSIALKDLILCMLQTDPTARLSCRRVARHMWLAGGKAVRPVLPVKYTRDNLEIQPCREEPGVLYGNSFSSAEMLSIPSITTTPQPRKPICFLCTFVSGVVSGIRALMHSTNRETDLEPEYLEHIFMAF